MKSFFKFFVTGLFSFLLSSCFLVKWDPPEPDYYSMVIDNQTSRWFYLYKEHWGMPYNMSDDYCPPQAKTIIGKIYEEQSIDDEISDIQFLYIDLYSGRTQFPIDVNLKDPLSLFFCDKNNWIKSDIDDRSHEVGRYTLTLEQEAFDKLLEQTMAYYDNISGE